MDYLLNNRLVKNQERIRFTLSKPFECRGIMKKYFQCLDHHEYNNNINDLNELKEKCQEHDYQSCLDENRKKLFENRIFNINKVAAEEEEE